MNGHYYCNPPCPQTLPQPPVQITQNNPNCPLQDPPTSESQSQEFFSSFLVAFSNPPTQGNSQDADCKHVELYPDSPYCKKCEVFLWNGTANKVEKKWSKGKFGSDPRIVLGQMMDGQGKGRMGGHHEDYGKFRGGVLSQALRINGVCKFGNEVLHLGMNLIDNWVLGNVLPKIRMFLIKN